MENGQTKPMSSSQSLEAPSDHLLRTLAAVPVSSQILDLGCGYGRHTEPLLRLGFPVHACDPRPEAVEATRSNVRDLVEEGSVESCVQEATLDALDYPEATFDWVVAAQAEIFVDTKEDLRALLEQSQDLLKPGGWLYITVHARTDTSDDPSSEKAEHSIAQEQSESRFTIEELEAQRSKTNLVEASRPTQIREHDMPRIRAIYRRVDPHPSE